MKVTSKTTRLVQMDRTFAKLVELGVDKKWLMKANPTPEEARELLKGLLYLKDLYPNTFKDGSS